MSLFIQHLKQSDRLKDLHFTICVVGSRDVEVKRDISWEVLAPKLTIYGFDADAEACEQINASNALKQLNYVEAHMPYALSGTVGESTLYVTKEVHCSSLYSPNQPFAKRLQGYQEALEVELNVAIETTTLDELFEQDKISQIDFLQIDVQGADLDVLHGASKLLANGVLGMEVEVEFSPLYQGQPLFSDIDVYLRELGFTLFDLSTDDLWCRQARACSPLRSVRRPGQLLWADAFYLRDLLDEKVELHVKTPESLLKLACIADTAEFIDYALEVLEYLTLEYGNTPQYNCAPEIVAALSKIPEIVEQGLDSLPIMQRISHRLK